MKAILLAPLLAALVASAAPSEASGSPTLVVAGFSNRVAEAKWRNYRLGMGLSGRLAELLVAEGDFELFESRWLAPSVREAVDGRWLAENPEAADLDTFFALPGVAWVATGTFEHLGVTRDRVTGPVSGRRFLYRAEVSVCLHPARGREFCARGEGESRTTVVGAGIEYRGSEVAFDQAGPAQAIDRAVTDAVARLLAAWRPAHVGKVLVAPPLPGSEPLALYVAAFDLAKDALERWPALAEAGVGLGLAGRIAEVLSESGDFRLLEEKAEVVARIARGLAGSTETVAEPLEAAWVLYGEVTAVTVQGHERAFRGATDETRVTVALRLVERTTRRVRLASGQGSATSPGTRDGRLDPTAVAEATGRAVQAAVARLVAKAGS